MRKPQPIRIEDYLEDTGALPSLAADVRRGLTASPKSLPPKYFYDELGSQLFEKIGDTPEYYLTRTEKSLLESVAAEVVAAVRPHDLVELGPGSSYKARVLLDAMRDAGTLERYVPVDVSPEIVERSAQELTTLYPGLQVRAVIGDFIDHLDKLPDGEPRLVVFLGSTLGNLERDHAQAFLGRVAALLGPQDAFLLGTDLVKDHSVLEAAYNDAAGVTAEFNRNILQVINRHLDGDFDPQAFRHLAFFQPAESRMEIYLESERAQSVRIGALDLTVSFEAGERVHTEYSHKYTREQVEALLEGAGMRLESWFTDPRDWFGLSLARRGRVNPPGSSSRRTAAGSPGC